MATVETRKYFLSKIIISRHDLNVTLNLTTYNLLLNKKNLLNQGP